MADNVPFSLFPDRQDERPADCIPYDTFERDESEKALPYGKLYTSRCIKL